MQFTSDPEMQHSKRSRTSHFVLPPRNFHSSHHDLSESWGKRAVGLKKKKNTQLRKRAVGGLKSENEHENNK